MNKNMEFKNNEKLVRYYFRLRNRNTAVNSLCDTEDNELVKAIDEILNSMKEDEKDILRNEYVLNYPRNWWQNYYSKSRYYRIKSNALRNFIRLSRW